LPAGLYDTIELALLADGVDPKKLYPLDVDRAFKSLDKIKPYVQKWMDTSTQTTQLIQQNELDFTNTYSGRVFSANREGGSLGFSLDQVIVHLDYFGVAKGAKNKAGAMQLLNSIISNPQRQANFFKIISYGPVTKAGYEACDPKLRSMWLPNPNNPNNVVANEKWWGDRYEEVTKRLKAWLGT
jgi:putative spermidine/putrescine transport system substrate-binding protein